MQGQLGEADPKQHHDQERDAVGQGRGDAGHGGDELDGDHQPHGGRDVGDALGEDRREREGVGAQALGLGSGWLHRRKFETPRQSQFRKYCGLVEIARCGFPWEKTTKRPTASVYTICETAVAQVFCYF